MKSSDVIGKLRHTSTVERMIAEPRRRRLLSSSGRAPSSRLPAGSRLRHRDRLLGNTVRGEWGGRSGRCSGKTEVWDHEFVYTFHCRDCPGSQKGPPQKGPPWREFCPHPTGVSEGSQQALPPSTGQKNAAAQAPSRPAQQLRKMAELLAPCLKKFSTRAPPPSPARQHRLRLRPLQLLRRIRLAVPCP